MNDQKTEFVKVRCTPEEKEMFRREASLNGLSLSDLIRRRVFEHKTEQPLGLFDVEPTAGNPVAGLTIPPVPTSVR